MNNNEEEPSYNEDFFEEEIEELLEKDCVLFSKEEYEFITIKYCNDILDSGGVLNEDEVLKFVRWMERARIQNILLNSFMNGELNVTGFDEEGPIWTGKSEKLTREIENYVNELFEKDER